MTSFYLYHGPIDEINNKLGELLETVEAGGISSGDVMRFKFKVPNVRVEYTVPLYSNRTYSFNNVNVTQALTNPSVDGKIKFKNTDGSYVKFSDGTDAEIFIPKANHSATTTVHSHFRAIMHSQSGQENPISIWKNIHKGVTYYNLYYYYGDVTNSNFHVEFKMEYQNNIPLHLNRKNVKSILFMPPNSIGHHYI